MSQPYTIFYADDDGDDREIFQSVVAEISNNHDLHVQRNGQELLNALENPPPVANVVFLDLNMPVKNGYEALAEIRTNEKMRQLPVVIFSTSDDERAVQQSKDLGANLYITKPDSYETLKRIVKEVLSIDWEKNPPEFKSVTYLAN